MLGLDREDGIGECCHILVHVLGECGGPISNSKCLFYYLPVRSVPKLDGPLAPSLINDVKPQFTEDSVVVRTSYSVQLVALHRVTGKSV